MLFLITNRSTFKTGVNLRTPFGEGYMRTANIIESALQELLTKTTATVLIDICSPNHPQQEQIAKRFLQQLQLPVPEDIPCYTGGGQGVFILGDMKPGVLHAEDTLIVVDGQGTFCRVVLSGSVMIFDPCSQRPE